MKYIIEKSYNEFVGEYEVYPTQKLARAKGYEAHHIIPQKVQKREKGKVYDDRCIRVTYFEHILAHYLYCKEHPEDINEHIALERMCNTRAKELLTDEKKFLDELPQMAEMREKGVPRGENHYLYGKHHSEEWRRKHSESMKGEKNPMYGRTGERGSFYGKHHSEEQKKFWSESIKGDKNPSAKKVFQRDLNGNIIQVFPTVKEAGIQLGKSVVTIRNYIHGKTPKNFPYIFSYN